MWDESGVVHPLLSRLNLTGTGFHPSQLRTFFYGTDPTFSRRRAKPRKAIPEILNGRVPLVEQVSLKTCDVSRPVAVGGFLLRKGTSHRACGLVPKAQAAELVLRFGKRRQPCCIGLYFF